MFNNFLRVLALGKDDEILAYKLWMDLDRIMADQEDLTLDLPAFAEGLDRDWLIATDWYQTGGYKAVQKAACGTMERQLELQLAGTWTEHLALVMSTWPTPGVVQA